MLQIYDLTALIKEPTCYLSQNPTFETGLSDHHKVISTIIESGTFKGNLVFLKVFFTHLRKRFYRSDKKFDNEYFSNALREELETVEGELEKKFTMF